MITKKSIQAPLNAEIRKKNEERKSTSEIEEEIKIIRTY